MLMSNAPESVHLCDYPEANKQYIDKDLINQVDALKKLVEMGRSARNKADLKIRQPLQTLFYVLEDDKSAEFIEANSSVILDELNVKEIKQVEKSEELINYIVKPNLAKLGQTFGKAIPAIKKALDGMNVNDIINQFKGTWRNCIKDRSW